MSNDTLTSKPDDAGENGVHLDPAIESHNAETAPASRASPAPSVIGMVNGLREDRDHGDPNADKSDSEAETVVLSGKEEDQEHKKSQDVDLEEANKANLGVDGKLGDAQKTNGNQSEGSNHSNSRKSSLKRKRTTQTPNTDLPEAGNSSNLSSTVSSPIQEAHSSKASGAASDRSRSSPPFDDIAQSQQRRQKKQRPSSKTRHQSHQEGKTDRDVEPVSARKRRDTRSATHYDDSTHRSESPPSHHSIRGHSTQPNLTHTGVTKRRKAPAPLHVERRRKASEDIHPDSDDSSSVHSHHHLHRFTSADNNVMSPAKMVSHKKNRDRNGRTLLARACAQDAAEVERWLKERPQDLDVPDNAGNTPLQIAALEGDTEIVSLLLEAGCDIHCKNIDKDTPLIDAVENGHLEVVRILLKAGLDPRVGNSRGREPLDLVPEDNEDGEEIRAALLASKKEKELLRRPSEDHNRQHSVGSRDVEMAGTSPVHGTRSPPPPGPGARRRTARSQPTDDALLWVNATPARLRDAAGKGDLNIVDHILKMRPQADTESVLAAARGGHEVVLGLLMAIAKPDPDPEPLRSGEYKLGYNTPMLAAIGRGNNSIIKLLLDQPGFDPTRRLFKGLTYYEIAKERKGSEWEDEVEMLKEAYDNHKQSGGRKSISNSPRKVRTKRADSARSSEPSSSPHDARKVRKSGIIKNEESPDLSRQEIHKEDSLLPHANTQSHAKVKKRLSSANTSDLERESKGPRKLKKIQGGASSDADHLTIKRADSLKPKRRLMSGNERRASLAAEATSELKRKSGDSVSREENQQRRSSDASESTAKLTSEEQPSVKGSPGKKRHRMSVSPQASKSDLTANSDLIQKKKRQRVDSQGNAVDQDRDRSLRPGPAMVANMVANSTAVGSPTLSQGAAPVAFMGSSVASPAIKSPADLRPDSAVVSPVDGVDQTLQRPTLPEVMPVHRQAEEDKLRQETIESERDRQAAREEEERIEKLEAEKQRQINAEREAQTLARAEREEAESKAQIAREEEEARLEAQRQAERQAQLEREEEEARIVKRKRDEEMQKRRKEDQERRRREQEERESLRRIRDQENEERLRRASLPNGLRRAAELHQDEARTAKEITKWLPLRTVTTQELEPERYHDSQIVEERWIANIQAAPILAITDLGLSQYTAWTRIPASINHQGSLWRQLRNPMSQATPLSLLSPEDVFRLDSETRPKFFSLKPIFWLRLSDFMDIVPRHQHLAGIQLKTRAIVLHEFPFGRGGTVDRPAGAEGAVKQENMSPIMNGNMTNGFR